jgi:hypothetical protein
MREVHDVLVEVRHGSAFRIAFAASAPPSA